MGAVVAQQFERVGMLARDDLDRRVLADHGGQIHHPPIELERERGLGEAGADGGRDVGAADRLVEFAHASVGQRDGNHMNRGVT